VKGNTKLADFVAVLLATTLFVLITAMEQEQRNERLQKLYDDECTRDVGLDVFLQ
jgi:hypothetical protein